VQSKVKRESFEWILMEVMSYSRDNLIAYYFPFHLPPDPDRIDIYPATTSVLTVWGTTIKEFDVTHAC
jgi:hypothetical protein